MAVQVFVGTRKGAFLFRSDDTRAEWDIEGPIFKGWEVTACHRLVDGTYLAATTSYVYGAALHRSHDLRLWEPIPHGPAYAAESGRKLKQIWTLGSGHGRVLAGVDEAGLFSSEDGGHSWSEVSGLNDHATRPSWQPGAGGLCAHSLLFDPRNPARLWCGISAVGVFRSEDAGATWKPRNDGVPVIIEDEKHKEIGFCVHALALDPDDPERIYRQDHKGMYRSSDGGDHWEPNDDGLPSAFGFPIALHPRTGSLFAVPLESDEYRMPADGALRVYRSVDRGDTWHASGAGLVQQSWYGGVLRGALAVDDLTPGGVYVGTTSGEVFLSSDDGDTWRRMPCTLPRVMHVSAYSTQ